MGKCGVQFARHLWVNVGYSPLGIDGLKLTSVYNALMG